MAHVAASDGAEHEVLAGRYELLGLIGIGGMGTVYRARDRVLDEIVALKMIAEELVLEPETLARFRQEVKLARRVTDRHVARTFDIGDHEGKRFLTMEYIEGESLAELVTREGALPLDRVVEIAEGICAGLAAAHAAGVVHRDLKPENVLIDKSGRVVLTDFGIARGGSAQLTSGGAVVGTPAYMAPEQVEGRPADARADLYALGAIVYEMLTGEAAWQGDSAFVVASARLTRAPPDPRAKNLELPYAVAELVLRCMARDPEERPASAGDVGGVLSGLTLPVRAGQPLAPVRAAGGVRVDEDRRTTLAVLPLENLGLPDDEYLADGLTEDLIDALSMHDGLRVRSRGAVMAMKGRPADPRNIGRDLGVSAIAEGSVQRVGDAVRIRVRLVSVHDGFQLWAGRIECAAAELLSVGSDETSHAIVAALTSRSLGSPPRAGGLSAEVLDLYMRARHLYHKRWRPALLDAVPLFHEALERAPDDPTLLSGFAQVLACLYSRAFEASEFYRDQAIAAARRALEVAPHRAEPRVALGEVLWEDGDAAAAATEAARALATAPDVADVQSLVGQLYLEAGAVDRAMPLLARALELDSAQRGARGAMARAHALRGDWDLADASLGPPPAGGGPEVSSYWLSRMRLVLWRGDQARARYCLGLIEAAPDFDSKWVTSRGLTWVAKRIRSEELLQRVQERAERAGSRRSRAFFHQQIAEILAGDGDPAAAFKSLAAAEREVVVDLSVLEFCPLFDAMRADPRFQAVVAPARERAREVLRRLTTPAVPA